MNPTRSLALLSLAALGLAAQDYPPYYYNPYRDPKFAKTDFSKPLPMEVDFSLTLWRPAPPSLTTVGIFAGAVKTPCPDKFIGAPANTACLNTPEFISVNQRGIAFVIQHNGEGRFIDGANAFSWGIPKGVSAPVIFFDNTDVAQGGAGSLMRADRFINLKWPKALQINATSLALDGWDRIWVADGASIQRTDAATGSSVQVALPAGSLDPYAQRVMKPQRVAADPTIDRLVFATDEALFELDPNSGKVTHLSGLPGTFGTTDGPKGTASFTRIIGLAVHRSGWVLVADAGVGQLRLIDPQGNVTTLTHFNGYLGRQGLMEVGELAFDGDTALVLAPSLHVIWKVF